jgi:hypothetical protein
MLEFCLLRFIYILKYILYFYIIYFT